MITVFAHRTNAGTFRRLMRTAPGAFPYLRIATYQDAFRALRVPAGTLIFTDFDLLNSIEMDAAARMADAARRADSDVCILNHPAYVCERYELLRRLYEKGLSPLQAVRLDEGRVPDRFPVFIRCEDHSYPPDTGLIETPEAYAQAVADLRAAGKTTKRRIAVSYEGEPGPDGHFRKYSAHRIGDHVVPQHVFRDAHWVVKRDNNDLSDTQNEEEFTYVRDNPHADLLMPVYETGDLQFGRADYAFKDGRLVIFEINTNPTFPQFTGGEPARAPRRVIVLERLKAAFAQIDDPDAGRGAIPFAPPNADCRMMQLQRWNWWTRMLWAPRARRARER